MIGFDPLTAASLLILAAGNPSVCPEPPMTKINVLPRTKDVKYNFESSMAELQAQEVDTIDPYGFHDVTMTQGFMQGQIKMTPKVKVDYEFISGNKAACLWYKTIDIEIEIDPTIVLAKEIAKDKCMKSAVLEHEMKHVKVDRQIVNKYAQIMGKKVYDALVERGFKVGPIQQEYAQETMNKMHKVVYQIVEHEYQKMAIERTELQRAVDNLKEYESVNALCPNYKAPVTKPKNKRN